MPTYVFRNEQTNEVFEKYLGMAELEQFKYDHKHLRQMPTILNAVGGIGDIKHSDGFKDLLNNIKANNPGSTMENY